MVGSPSAVIHCNAGGEFGMGHLMRAIAVAEEATRRAWVVRITGCFSRQALAVLARTVPSALVTSFPAIPSPAQWQEYLRAAAPDVVHVDTYVGDEGNWDGGSWLLSNVHDGEFGTRRSDVSIDPNLDASPIPTSRRDVSQLVGVDYSLIRDQVRGRRRDPVLMNQFKKILVVMGGTDPTEITPRVISLLHHIPGARTVTVITPPHVAQAANNATRSSPHEITLLPFADDLPRLAADNDLVLSAAGTSVWDFACIGMPMGLVCAVDNQRKGYDAAIKHGIAFPLGHAYGDELDQGFASFGSVVRQDPRRLHGMAQRALQLVDGEGPRRILDEWSRRLISRAVPKSV